MRFKVNKPFVPRYRSTNSSKRTKIVSFRVYILRWADDSYYTGHTDNLEKRIEEHQSGAIAGYTTKRRPVRLMWSQEFTIREEALAAERQIKGWSRSKKRSHDAWQLEASTAPRLGHEESTPRLSAVTVHPSIPQGERPFYHPLRQTMREVKSKSITGDGSWIETPCA